MSRPGKNEKKLKLKALRVAMILLRREFKVINYITVRNKANEIGYPKHFIKKISKGAVEQPSTQEYKDIKTKIKKYKKEKKKIKVIGNNISNGKIKKLEAKVDDLTFNIASLLENERELKELLESKEKTIEKIKSERDIYINRIGNEYRL